MAQYKSIKSQPIIERERESDGRRKKFSPFPCLTNIQGIKEDDMRKFLFNSSTRSPVEDGRPSSMVIKVNSKLKIVFLGIVL